MMTKTRLINENPIPNIFVVYHFAELKPDSAAPAYTIKPIAINTQPSMNILPLGGIGEIPGLEAYQQNNIHTSPGLITKQMHAAQILAVTTVIRPTER